MQHIITIAQNRSVLCIPCEQRKKQRNEVILKLTVENSQHSDKPHYRNSYCSKPYHFVELVAEVPATATCDLVPNPSWQVSSMVTGNLYRRQEFSAYVHLLTPNWDTYCSPQH